MSTYVRAYVWAYPRRYVELRFDAIAALIRIAKKTLLKQYREELDLGDAQGCLRGAKALSQLIEDGSKRRSSAWFKSG